MRSLRSRLILASVLWTAGLLMVMHMVSMMLVIVFPRLRGVHSGMAVLAGFALMAVGFVAARRSLEPFQLLRERLTALRQGSAPRVDGDYPTEIRPLIDDLNVLLEEREKTIQRAQATAGDLAHALKTPLALLRHEAESLRAAGQHGAAETVSAQVDKMARQVDYQLARARAATAGAAQVPVRECAEAVIRAVNKIHASRPLTFDCQIDAHCTVRLQREDLEEMLGNLLDNACRFAASRIALAAQTGSESLVITVDDDGPGLPPALRDAVLRRGVRADEAEPGSGLGLAIVRDLAELYGGKVQLEAAPLGGLRARLQLPGVVRYSA